MPDLDGIETCKAFGKNPDESADLDHGHGGMARKARTAAPTFPLRLLGPTRYEPPVLF